MNRPPDPILCDDCAETLEHLHLGYEARQREALLMARECPQCDTPDGGEQ